MTTLFIPQNEEQKNLKQIIENDSDKNKRKRALNKLRKLLDRNEIVSTVQVKEYYDSIHGKPSYFKKFRSATIMIFPKNSNVEYNYK